MASAIIRVIIIVASLLRILIEGAQVYDSPLELSLIDGSNGFILNGIQLSDFSGCSVADAGDFNGDGIDDVIIGANGAGPNGQRSGQGYVVFGTVDRVLSGIVNLAQLEEEDEILGVTINGISGYDEVFTWVNGAGDFNHDGYDDIIIGSVNDSNIGINYIVYGGVDVRNDDGIFELSSINGSNGFAVKGGSRFPELKHSGGPVSGVGDFNGDGFDDVLLSGYLTNQNENQSATGSGFILYGGGEVGRNSGVFDLSSIDGTNGIIIGGINFGDEIGFVVSSAGDFNGDNCSDVLIGSVSGEVYMIYGGRSVASSNDGLFEVSSLNGVNGFRLTGVSPGALSGYSVSGVGDVNGDGYDDVAIGVPGAAASIGETFVIFGTQNINVTRAGMFHVTHLNGSHGFSLQGIAKNDYSGCSVSGAGDYNGDGFHDLIIGACRASPNGNTEAGESYLIFGASDLGSQPFDLSSLDGRNGIVIHGMDVAERSGYAVSGAGDFNADGYDDVIIGAYNAKVNGQHSVGRSYLVYGYSRTPITESPSISISPTVSLIPSLAPSSILPTITPVYVPVPLPTFVPSPVPSTSPLPAPTMVPPTSTPVAAPTPTPTGTPTTTSESSTQTQKHNTPIKEGFSQVDIFGVTLFSFILIAAIVYMKKWCEQSMDQNKIDSNVEMTPNSFQRKPHKTKYGKMKSDDIDEEEEEEDGNQLERGEDDFDKVFSSSSLSSRSKASKAKKTNNPFVDPENERGFLI